MAHSSLPKNYLKHQFYSSNGFSYTYSDESHPSPAQWLNHDADRITPSKSKKPKKPKKRKPQNSPSSDYLADVHETSVKIDSPSELRKLLVVDLNGTLVYRSPHSSRRVHQGAASGQHTPFRLRAVHLRPYMRSFREYLFHPHTRDWLDTMVWSSAQPHSVEDMVNKSFSDLKEHLVAIWARDTLGLNERDYHRKTQTTKDLSKPWSWYNHSSDARYTDSQVHSALTTLLLDDTPRKAFLQPYNHLCIQEYDGALRNADMEALAWESEREKKRQQQEEKAPSEDRSSSPTSSSSGSDIPGLVTSVRRKASSQLHTRPNKKRKRSRPTRSPSTHAPTLSSSPNPAIVRHFSSLSSDRDPDLNCNNQDDDILQLGYDKTLLAVIGVLETIKWESNVAGWIRAGGLTNPVADEGNNDSTGTSEGDEVPLKRKKLSHVQSEVNHADTDDYGTSNVQTDDEEPTSDDNDDSVVNDDSDDVTLADSGRWQWFHDGAATAYWAREGLRALRALGVEVDAEVL